MKNTGNWWLPAIKGLLAVVLGVLIVARPLEAALSIALFIGVFAMLGGIMLMIYALTHRQRTEEWGWLLAEGLFDVLIGIAIIAYPGLSALLLTSLLGVWLVLSGIFQLIYFSRRRRRTNSRRGQMALFNGIITILLGLVILINPLGGAIGLSIVIGIAAVVYGILLIYTAFRLREQASDGPPLYNEHSIQP